MHFEFLSISYILHEYNVTQFSLFLMFCGTWGMWEH